MKKLILILAVATACSPRSSEEHIDHKIALVENGLIRPVYIEGDSLWNIEERMKHYGVPGASIAVIENNKIAWLGAYGIMDKETNEPVTTKTLFQAGSISKPVAAYGALKAVESGKLNLTQDINASLTSWKIPDNEFTNEKKVTLEHLMSHTGGLTVHGFLGYSPDLPVPSLVQVLDGSSPANSPAIRVDKTPGGSFRYSGGGYCVMQQAMIDVYGKSFPEIEKEGNLNRQGYQLLEAGNGKLAQNVFRINTMLYPNSFNVYDSYADACKANGDNKEAIANYKKALKLNPKNEESAKKLAELENISK